MTSRCLVIGDVHVRIDNLEEIQRFIGKLEATLKHHTPHFIVLLGDVLHTHERIHTSCLQAAETLFRVCSEYAPTYVLVGNHDYISNSQFLTSCHWMTPFKAWPNLTIVDRVVAWEHEGNRFVACPYVPDGRFVEALTTYPQWQNAHLLFGHQTLDGVYMGAIKCENVESWLPHYPLLCSGHIHDKQEVSPNLYYTGTPFQHAFGEKRNKSIVLFTVTEGVPTRQELMLHISDKRLEYMTVQEAYHYVLNVAEHETVRLTVRGTREECRVFKKSNAFQSLSSRCKIVLDETETVYAEEIKDHSFHDVLYQSIQSNFFLTQLYKKHARLSTMPDLQFE